MVGSPRDAQPEPAGRQRDPFRIPLLNVQWATKLTADGGGGQMVRATSFLPRAWLVDQAAVRRAG